MTNSTLFNEYYYQRKHDLLNELLEKVDHVYTPTEVDAMRIDIINADILSQRSGRGFVNRDLVETLLGNLLECVAPGSHNAVATEVATADLRTQFGQISDQLYAMVAQSFLAAGESQSVEEKSLASTFNLLWNIPLLKERALWNRFAALCDPAVWDAYLLFKCPIEEKEFIDIDFTTPLEHAISNRDVSYYRQFLTGIGCSMALDYQMQLVMSTYPGWRILFYHDVAHALIQSGPVAYDLGCSMHPVPLLPRAISELAGRYYQADLHPETVVGDANFLDHPHRGLTTGQTGVIGSGCHIYPCTLGGLSDKVQQRHPIIGDFVSIGTDASLYGSVEVGDRSVIGANAEVHGFVTVGKECRVGASVFVGTIRDEGRQPGRIFLRDGVRVGAGTIIENNSEQDLVVTKQTRIPARSYVVNNGSGEPSFVKD